LKKILATSESMIHFYQAGLHIKWAHEHTPINVRTCTHTKRLESAVFQHLIASIYNNYTIMYQLNWHTNHKMGSVRFQHHKSSHEKISH